MPYNPSRFYSLLILLLLCNGLAHATPRISIIIDDIGLNQATNRRAIELPGNLTYAILPRRPYSRTMAEYAHLAHKEIMLHLPMQAMVQSAGQGTLRVTMSKRIFQQTLLDDLHAVPYIRGFNNHMGSLLTQNKEEMQWLMQMLQTTPLYFIDSRTIASSVAEEIAKIYHIPTLKRDIFLDHTRTLKTIDHQFNALIHLAKKRGYALAIAHPYPETLQYLEATLPTLHTQGITLVSVSHLLAFPDAP